MGNAFSPALLSSGQTGQEYVGVSRRPPDIEDYVEMIRRHRAWILGPVYAGVVVAVVIAFLWPDTYVSSAVMRITPPQVPERLVPSATNVQMADRLQQMQQDILSRPSLSELIQRPGLDLYRDDRARKPMEDVIEHMRRGISINVLEVGSSRDRRGASAFRIAFSYPDRYKAQAVVRELVTKFTEQNVRVLKDQTSLTTNFLNDEQQSAKAVLDRLTTELSQFRSANQGRLPEQVQSNAAALNSLQMQLYSLNDATNRAYQEKLTLETNLENVKRQIAFYSASNEEQKVAVTNERLEALKRAVQDLETRISSLLETYKDTHPDIRRQRAQLDVLKRERDQLEAEDLKNPTLRSVGGRSGVQAEGIMQELKNSLASTQTTIQNKNLEIEERSKQQAQLQRRVAEMQARIEAAPASEQRYAQLLQDVSIAKQRYEELSKKKDMSETAQALEERKGGENLEVLDPPSLPEQPTEPNRLMIALIGAGGGLALGVFVAGAKEMKDTSLKNLKDVRAYTNLPVLSSVPLLENALLVRRKRRLFWLAWTAAVIVGLVTMAGAMYYYYFGRA